MRGSPRALPAQPRGAARLQLRAVLHRVVRARVGGAVVYWGFSPSKAAPVLILQDLFVLERHRRTGVATLLLRHLEDVARSRGATRVQLETDADNAGARRLYAGMGFELLPQKTVYMRFL